MRQIYRHGAHPLTVLHYPTNTNDSEQAVEDAREYEAKKSAESRIDLAGGR